MCQPFDRGAPAGVDHVLGTNNCLVNRKPTQRQSELRPLVAELNIILNGADLHPQIREGKHRVARLLKKATGQPYHVPWQHEVDDLSLAIAQQFVTRSIACLDKAELAIFVAVDHEIPAPRDREFHLDQAPEAVEVILAQKNVALEPDDK